MDQVIISVIVPVYRVEKYLNKCIDSILEQTFKKFELILVDDGSPDNSGKICDEYEEKDNRIKVIHKSNGGLSDARNVGIDIAKGEFITFLDSDDWVERNTLEVLYKAQQKTNSDIVQAKAVVAVDDFEVPIKCTDSVITYTNIEALKLLQQGNNDFRISPCAKLYKRFLFKDIRYPKGYIHEDEYTTPRLIFEAKTYSIVDAQVYHYRLSPNSIMRSNFSKKKLDRLFMHREMIDFYNKVGIYDLAINEQIQYSLSLIMMFKAIKKNMPGEKADIRKIRDEYRRLFPIVFRKVSIKRRVHMLLYGIIMQVC